MGIDLTGKTVSSTYDGLIKTTDNQPITDTAKILTDGYGNDSAVKLGKQTIELVTNKTADFTAGTTNVKAPTDDTNATTKLYVDTADNTLQTNIDNEESARITADTTLQSNIDAEASARSSADAAIQADVDTNASNIATNTTNIATNTSDITALEDAVSNISTDVSTNTAAIATNAANIASNDTDIAANASAIADLENGVGNITSFNTLTGDVTISAGTNISFNTVGQNIEISSTGGGGGGSDSFNTFTVPSQPDVVAASGNDTMNFVDGNGISMTTNNTTKTITFNVDGLGDTTLANGKLWLGDLNGVPQETQRITVNNLPTLTTDHIWKGSGGVPIPVNLNTLSVASAINATDAANIKVDAITSGTYRLLVSDTGIGAGAYTRAKSDVADGLTFNTTGDVLSTGAFTATYNVTAGNALIGASLDISGSASIDGTLQLGGIGNVEGEINQNTSDIADLQAQVYSAPVTETASLTIGDGNYSTYVGKTILMNSASAMDFELDMTTAPAIGEEIYVVQFGAGTVSVLNYQGTIYSTAGTNPSTRAQYSSMVLKHVGSNNWLVIGDIE